MPAIGVAALEKQVVAGRLDPIYLLVGDDTRLVDQMVDRIESVIDPADRAFAVERLYAGEPGGTPLAIAGSAQTLPMLGNTRLVVVLRAERLLKPKRKAKAAESGEQEAAAEDEGPADDTGPLEDYLASPVASTILVFVATEIDRTRRLTKRVLSAATEVSFAGLADRTIRDYQSEAARWLKDALARAERSIDRDAMRMLIARCGRDMTKLRGDVERLLLFIGERTRITADDVMEVSADGGWIEDEWAVVNAIAGGDAARALVEVGQRLDRGDSPHGVVGQLRWWVSNRLVQGDPARVPAALEALLRTDLALKSSGGDGRVLVERLVVDLTGRPVSAERGWGRRG